jgi:hypothetical protein
MHQQQTVSEQCTNNRRPVNNAPTTTDGTRHFAYCLPAVDVHSCGEHGPDGLVREIRVPVRVLNIADSAAICSNVPFEFPLLAG